MTDFWNAWNWNPLIGTLLAFMGWRYMDGVWRLWRRAGTGRGVSQGQVAAFWTGLLVLFIALISPIDTWGEQSLSMHMIQHLLLMLIAPPLLIVGLPPLALIGMIPLRWRRDVGRWWRRQHSFIRIWHFLSGPLVLWTLFALVMWLWHIPALYEAAVRSPLVHLLEHGSFFGSALLFWWGIRTRPGLSILLVFTTAIHSGLLGALMTFSTQVWYPIYGSLEDQQMAGLIMWIPGGTIFLAAGLLLLWRWLIEMEGENAKDTTNRVRSASAADGVRGGNV